MNKIAKLRAAVSNLASLVSVQHSQPANVDVDLVTPKQLAQWCKYKRCPCHSHEVDQ